MDKNEFIDSGILEEYCIGWLSDTDKDLVIRMALLHPEVKEELSRVKIFMAQFSGSNAVELVTSNVQEEVLGALDEISQKYFDLDDLPVIDTRSDYQVWLNSLQHLIPVEPTEDVICEVLRKDYEITQKLLISKSGIPQESRRDVLKSFLILQGECECTIGNDVLRGGPGSLIEIPLHVEHDVKVLSPRVVAVLQHKAV